MADQERRIAEQERRMAQRERDTEESSRRESQANSRKRVEEVEEAEVDDPPPPKSLSKKAKEAGPALAIAPPLIQEEHEEYREEESEPETADLMADLPGVEAPLVAPSLPSPRNSEAIPVKRIGVRRANADWKQEESEMELAELDVIESNTDESPFPETRGVNVYDEYWELLKETREAPASVGETPGAVLPWM